MSWRLSLLPTPLLKMCYLDAAHDFLRSKNYGDFTADVDDPLFRKWSRYEVALAARGYAPQSIDEIKERKPIRKSVVNEAPTLYTIVMREPRYLAAKHSADEVLPFRKAS